MAETRTKSSASSGKSPGDGGSQPLVKYLVACNAGSRRASAALIMGGRVQVNGEKALGLMQPVARGDKVTLNGATVQPQQTKTGPTYLALNKPPGYVTSVRDEHGRKTVMSLVPVASRVPGLVPAGRLDMDSTGLIVLTNDGDLVYRLTHPRFEVEREYHVVTDAPLQPHERRALLEGVPLDGKPAKVASLRSLPALPHQGREQARYSVVLMEGRNREARRLFEAVGRHVLALRRVRMGPLHLGSLPAGQTRTLQAKELQEVRLLLGLENKRAPRPAPKRKGSTKNERAKLFPKKPIGRGGKR
jgi:23S rRNA pseudouridine2605 synthase